MSAKWVLIAIVSVLVAVLAAMVYTQYRPSQQNLLETIDQAPSWQGAPKFVALSTESEADEKRFTERLRAAAADVLPDATVTEERLFVDNGRVWDAVRKSGDAYFDRFGYSRTADSSTTSGEWTVNYITWRPGNGFRRSFDKRIALVLEMSIPRDRGKLAGFFVMQPKD
ncbi:hypothetical protein [Mycolicibacterium houstonense]|uniref:hypothetical protein n=2 Tax=Mycolicibacterium houstonense TaxID=146021 RepID=UPI000AE63BB0|nr:hypothetical protein [Mycolicibacterium houstonense]